MDNSKKTQPTNTKPSDDPYMLGDPIPTPEVIETNTDSVWAMWQDSTQEPKTPSFDETVPMALEDMPPSPKP